MKGVIDANTLDTFILSFDKQSTTESDLKKTVTFESTIEDIKELRQLNHLHFSTAIATTSLVKNAEKLHENGKDEQAEKLLEVAIKLIEKSPERFVDPIAEEILTYDFDQLKIQLGN